MSAFFYSLLFPNTYKANTVKLLQCYQNKERNMNSDISSSHFILHSGLNSCVIYHYVWVLLFICTFKTLDVSRCRTLPYLIPLTLYCLNVTCINTKLWMFSIYVVLILLLKHFMTYFLPQHKFTCHLELTSKIKRETF